ncbi:MAG TPA: sulfotransferase family 2 domain-containing protein [Pseudolabrys sp.]|nr:sulfotransferase family 2 domain-containing protein [Pseudolabrys sp.]
MNCRFFSSGGGNPSPTCTMPRRGARWPSIFLFLADHGYGYLDPDEIHLSKFGFIRLGPDFGENAVKAFNALSPETFSIVRDPLHRFISGFVSKIFTRHDANYRELRDLVTSVHGIDLSAEADPAQACLAFAKLIDAQKDQKQIERHFRPQALNLADGGRFRVDTIIRLEDRDALLAFFAKWTNSDKARWLVSQKIGATPGHPREKFISRDLTDLVRKIYARDYELFYA